jgi:large subunit ribosomal protein L6
VSRIGRLPVTVPAGVQVQISGQEVHVKGPKGEMKRLFSPIIGIKMESNQVIVTRESEEQTVRALHGTTRALINNMVTGVSTGFQVVLNITRWMLYRQMESPLKWIPRLARLR